MGTVIVRMRGSKTEKIRHTAIAPARELTAKFGPSGETDGFEELVRRYSAFIFSLCYRITNDRHDAEDATQIAFLQLAIAIKSGTKIQKPVGWLESVAKRQAARIIRGRSRLRRREQRASKDELHLTNHEQAIDELAIAGVVRDALDELPEHYRLPLVLHYFSGMSLESIAAELKSTARTIGTRLHRGRKMLGERLEKKGLRFEPGMLATILAVGIPAAIAKSISEHVAAMSNAPASLAPSIMRMIHLSAGAVMRRKLTVAAVVVAATATSAALAAKVGSFSLGPLNIHAVIRWVHEIIEPPPLRLSDVNWPDAPSNLRSPVPTNLVLDDGQRLDPPITSPPVQSLANADQRKTSTPQAHTHDPAAEIGRTSVLSAESKSVPVILQRLILPSRPDPRSSRSNTPSAQTSQAIHDDPKPVSDSEKSTSPSGTTLLASVAQGNLSGTYSNVIVPPYTQGGSKLRGFGDVTITGVFDQNGRVVADGKGSRRQLNLSHLPPIQNTIDNPASGSNGWYAVNGGILTLPPLHVDSENKAYTWGESASDPQIDLINSVRLRPRGLHSAGDVSLSLLTLASDQKQFSSLPGGWGILGLWRIDNGGMQADAIDLTVRYNQIAAGFLPTQDQYITFLTYDGQWNATAFTDVEVDRMHHLISGELPEPFGYFAVAGPLDPPIMASDPRLSVIVPEPSLLLLAIPFLCARRRRGRKLH